MEKMMDLIIDHTKGIFLSVYPRVAFAAAAAAISKNGVTADVSSILSSLDSVKHFG